MKALITALALLSFVGASTLPLATPAQAQTTDQTQKTMKKKAPKKHVASKKSTKKHVAKHKTKKPATQQG
ncbi:MAG TPA: hypothetical protein VMC10_10060 [Stellaceae bacterium]|nr:hypothetical protein [Stellaceae bacterium]